MSSYKQQIAMNENSVKNGIISFNFDNQSPGNYDFN